MTLSVAIAACGGGGGGADAGGDAGSTQRTLEILQPPGDQIGLASAESRELRVRYLDEHGAPIVAGEVSFKLEQASDSDPKGATLSAASALTDAGGVARVNVTAGTPTTFRVSAEAPRAPAATFFVSVSDQGFASISATPRHLGPRSNGDLATVAARLYPAGTTSCAAIDASAPPASPLPERVGVLGDALAWPEIPAGAGYTLAARAESVAGVTLAAACVELGGEQVPAGTAITLQPVLVDRPVALAAGGYALTTLLDLGPVAEDSLRAHAWRDATCPLGGAQVLLDWMEDALDGGDALDGVVAAPGAAAQAIEAKRALGGDGCRLATLPGGGASVDAAIDPLLHAGASPAPSLPEKGARLEALLSELKIESTLTPAVGGCTHTLGRASVTTNGFVFSEDLAASARPIVSATGVACDVGDGPAPAVTIGAHGFTLRLGSFVRDGFIFLAGSPAALASDLVAGAGGCGALSSVVCTAAGLGSACLAAACTSALPALDAALAAPFDALDGAGLDLDWSGTTTALDLDVNLQAESLSGGLWSGDVTLASGGTIAVAGTFAGAAIGP